MNRAPKAELAFGAFSFWRREREIGFGKVSSLTNLSLKKSAFVFRSSREPPIIRAFERPSKPKRKKSVKLSFLFGAGGGIRTPVGFHPNGFQDRLVMTASIHLHCFSFTFLLYLPKGEKSMVFTPENIKSLAKNCKGVTMPYSISNSGGTSSSSETYLPFFFR